MPIAEPKPAAKRPRKRKPRTLPKFQHQRPGQPTRYEAAFGPRARRLALLGLVDAEIADQFGIALDTLYGWRRRYPEFSNALDAGKMEADGEVAESLFDRSRGMSVPEVKIFMPAVADAPVYAPYQEHLPPDVGAAKLWLVNRQRARWPGTERVDVTVKSSLTERLNHMTLEERGALSVELAARIRQRLADAGLDDNGDPIIVIENEPAEAVDDGREDSSVTPSPSKPVTLPLPPKRNTVTHGAPPVTLTLSRGQTTGRWGGESYSPAGPALPVEEIDAKAVAGVVPAEPAAVHTGLAAIHAEPVHGAVVHDPVHAEPDAARKAYRAEWMRQNRAKQKAVRKAGRPETGSVADPVKSQEPPLAGGRNVAPGPRS
jgi:transposase-like protein